MSLGLSGLARRISSRHDRVASLSVIETADSALQELL
jgi:hypothetical protein